MPTRRGLGSESAIGVQIPTGRAEAQTNDKRGEAMIRDVPLTGIFVNDQDAALDFYAGKLGLVKVQDEPYDDNARWITVSPEGTGTRIVLKKAEHDHERALVGRSDGAPILTLGTDDVRAAYEELRGRGALPRGAVSLPVGPRRDPAGPGRQPSTPAAGIGGPLEGG
jgi:catechol 2,3-dioxygenase-like lactoylglutathione lyase family enzyme